ncbi:hypothetical protein [Comamonas sp. E6]|uniref:hypothetical protein n=1 Tax=Comamonas sp. E6 TaxID=364029 RepID=UPI0006392C23|nr:hypothetical protein [Comamonas sp. E6]GAO68749.1 hypothetical protein CSE6_003_01860 [Comamonas sp. E6]
MENIYSVYKYKNFFLNYVLKYRPGRPLVIIFSAVDSFPGRNLTSYFGYQKNLDASVLHLIDNFGAHGCYYMKINGDSDISEGFAHLIQEVILNCNVSLSETWFCGTSKGASAALFFSLKLGGGNCLLGEPQIMIGDFLFENKEPKNESARSIAYTMTGKIDGSVQSSLNAILIDMGDRYFREWALGGGRAILYVSEYTGYMWRHVRHLKKLLEKFPEADKKFCIKVEKFLNHNDVADIFKNALELKIGLLNKKGNTLLDNDASDPPEVLQQSLSKESNEKFGNLNKKYMIFDIDGELSINQESIELDVQIDADNYYEVEYSLLIGQGVSIARGLVFSVLTKESAPIDGLIISPIDKIGYFKYLSSKEKNTLFSFRFYVPKGCSVSRVALIPWESKAYGALISNLRFYKC